MPRNAAISRSNDASSPRPETRHVTVTLSQPDSIMAWDALVARCGGAQAAFEALVLLPAAMHGAGVDPDVWLTLRRLQGSVVSG